MIFFGRGRLDFGAMVSSSDSTFSLSVLSADFESSASTATSLFAVLVMFLTFSRSALDIIASSLFFSLHLDCQLNVNLLKSENANYSQMSDAIMLGFMKLGKLSNEHVFGLIELY